MTLDKDYTIMFLSETSGRHYAVKISLGMLVTAVLVVAGLTVCALLSVTGYIGLSRKTTAYQQIIARQEHDLSELTEEKKEALLYKQWADKIIFRRLHFEDGSGRGNTAAAEGALSGEIPLSGAPHPAVLDVDEFDVRRLNLDLDFEVSFKLINRSGRTEKMLGYLFIVAGNSEVVPQVFAAWPPVSVVSGIPEDYKKGTDFAIRYLKPVKGRISQPDIGSKFNRVDVLAYSDDGKLLMKKGFYIERLLQQSPYE